MKKKSLLFLGMLAWGAMSMNAQITKNSVWAPTSDATVAYLNGGNYKNTVQAGVTITVLDNGFPDISKTSPVFPTDYKFPQWDLMWHFNNLKDNINNTDPSDDVLTTYFKISNTAIADTLFWVASATDPLVPYNKTIAASHLPTRNGIFYGGVDATGGKHAFGLISGKDWGRLQTYTSGGNAVLVESVSDFTSLLNWGKTIKERTRTGSGTTASPYVYGVTTYTNNFLVADSASAFGLKIGENNNALAFYPGKFDKTDLRMAFQFDSSRVSSDITFKLLQVDKGTSGKNMTYKMIVSIEPPTSAFVNIGAKLFVTPTGPDQTENTALGETGPERFVIDNIFSAQGGAGDMTTATTISVLDKIKTKNPAFTIDDFSKKRMIVSIIGVASEPAAQGTYHPIIALDDIHVSYWIDWYKYKNKGLYAGVAENVISSTDIVGLTGQIKISGALEAGDVYNISGIKVASFGRDNQVISVPAGVYLVKEQGQPVVKVCVK
jgi:hypothetical protein